MMSITTSGICAIDGGTVSAATQSIVASICVRARDISRRRGVDVGFILIPASRVFEIPVGRELGAFVS